MTTTSFMAKRHEPKDSADYYPTPGWATRALAERFPVDGSLIWEPASGGGHMAQALAEYSPQKIIATDLYDHTPHRFDVRAGVDFLTADILQITDGRRLDWVVTNPPFNRAGEFISRALSASHFGVAMFARTVFIEGCGRYNDIFSQNPPSQMLQFSERVGINKGVTARKSSSATACAWFVWVRGAQPAPIAWLPPGTRKRLERYEDYDIDSVPSKRAA